MSDFGSDVGNTVVSQTMDIASRFLKIIGDLIAKIYDTWENRHKRELDKLKVKDIKDELKQAKAIERLEGVYGAIALKQLKKTGEELAYPAVFMSERQMNRLAEECKRNGVLFSALQPIYDEKEKYWKYPLVCRKKDLAEITFICESLTREFQIIRIDEKINELEAKGENMTKEDKAAVEKLKKDKAILLQDDANQMNDKTADDTVNKAVNREEYNSMDFDKALNRHTGKLYDNETEYVIADVANPTSYIKCRGYTDEYNGKKYGKTEYEVYKDGTCVYTTHDGRFDERPLTYWQDEKAKMKELGGFGDRLFKFTSIETYQRWADKCIEENRKELSNMSKEGDVDYSALIKEAEHQLHEHQGYFSDGKVYVYDLATPEGIASREVVITDDMSLEEKANFVEMIVIGRQIENYQDIQNIKTELTAATLTLSTLDEGSDAYKEAQASLSEIQGRYDTALETKKMLVNEREYINAVQTEQEVREEVQNEIINDEHSKDGHEKSELAHDERLNEEKPKFMSMEKYDSEIEHRKEVAKANQVEVKTDPTKEPVKKSEMEH